MRAIVSIDAVFFATVDPATMLFASVLTEEPLWEARALFLDNEFGHDDVNKFVSQSRSLRAPPRSPAQLGLVPQPGWAIEQTDQRAGDPAHHDEEVVPRLQAAAARIVPDTGVLLARPVPTGGGKHGRDCRTPRITSAKI